MLKIGDKVILRNNLTRKKIKALLIKHEENMIDIGIGQSSTDEYVFKLDNNKEIIIDKNSFNLYSIVSIL